MGWPDAPDSTEPQPGDTVQAQNTCSLRSHRPQMRRKKKIGRPRVREGNIGKQLPSQSGVAAAGKCLGWAWGCLGVTLTFSKARPSCQLSGWHACPKRTGRVHTCACVRAILCCWGSAAPRALCERGTLRQLLCCAPLRGVRGAQWVGPRTLVGGAGTPAPMHLPLILRVP